MLESHSPGMEILKLVLAIEANSRDSPEPLNYTVTLTGLEPPHNKITLLIRPSSRQQEESTAGKICSCDHSNYTSVFCFNLIIITKPTLNH